MWVTTANLFFQAAEGAPQAAPFWFNLLLMGGLFGIVYFLIIRPQVKQQKEQQKLIDNLKKGDKVITSGGIWGEVDTVERQFILLKIQEKNKIKITRSAISGLQPSPEKGESK